MTETTIADEARVPLVDGVRRVESSSEQVVRDLGRLAEAGTAAATHYWLGSLRVMGDLAVNLLNASRSQRPESARASTFSGNVSGSVCQAAHDSARVISESMNRFTEVLSPPAPTIVRVTM